MKITAAIRATFLQTTTMISAKEPRKKNLQKWPQGNELSRKREEADKGVNKTGMVDGQHNLPFCLDMIDEYARVLFPLTFVLFNIIYWLIFLRKYADITF